jgi:Bacterial regulatory proteins, luxR family
MIDGALHLGPREQQIVDLLLKGYENEDIAKELNIAIRTVKAHFNRLFIRFGIRSGIKRVKLATLLYRRQLWLEKSGMELASPVSGNIESSNSSPRDSRTETSPLPSVPQSTWSKTIYAPSTTN